MSSDNAQSAVTYTSISSDLDRPSWGIPLMNVDEFSKMDPYEEVAQQGKVHPLSPAYISDPMELDEHVSVYVSKPEHPEYHAPLDDDIPVKDDDEDPKKDPSEEHEHEDNDEDPKEDPNKEHKDTKDPSEVAVGSSLFPLPPTSPPYDQAPLGHTTAVIRLRDDILEEDMPPQRRFVFTAPPPGCNIAGSSTVARAPRGQYDFLDTIEAGQGLIRSPGHDAWTISRAADREEDVGYIRALHASEHRMMTFTEETDRRDVRLKINVVKGQRTAYETKLRENHVCNKIKNKQRHNSRIPSSYDRSGNPKKSTHTQDDANQSLGGGLKRPVQPTRVCSYTDFMKCQPLNFKRTKGVVGLSQWLEKMESVFYISFYAIDNQVKFATCTLLGAALTWWNGHVRTLGHDAAYAMTWGTLKKKLMDKYYPKAFPRLALMYTKFLADETKKVDKYISGLPDNIHENVMSARPKTLDETIELANDLMDKKLRTYAERQNENKRKTDDSSRNNQQQPHKKQNVSRAYTAGPGEKKVYTRDLPLCTKCNYHHIGKCAPKCGKCKRYGHTTRDCQVNTNNNNNNNRNQKARACYECGNTRHIKKNCPKLKNRANGNGNGVAQGRAYTLGGRDTSPDSNVITSMFLLNNRYPKILFDTGADRRF
nr:hypothetical protein [Tanacetum cinerariifolium]